MIVAFEPPTRLLSMNDRMHWRAKAQHNALWLQAASIAARQVLRDTPWEPRPSIVTVTLPVRDNRRRDPHNFFPTLKPIIDGLVLAGVWPDDNSAWVTTTEPMLHVGGREVVVAVNRRG